MFYRSCPNCNKEMSYKLEVTRNRAKKKESLCQGCGSKKVFEDPLKLEELRLRNKGRKHSEESKRKMSISQKNKWTDETRKDLSEKMSGENNPFYGKTHSKETIQKMVENRSYDYITDDFREKMSKVASGENNPMYGRTFYDVWVEKHGKEEADKRLKAFKEKMSIQSKGEKNPMYGKPSPQGSGNGWSGWYNGVFFRSMMELSYMIYMDENNIKWDTAEKQELKIPYLDENNQQRNYFPDFLVEDKLIEIKPLKLQNTVRNQLKKEAAIVFCKREKLTYQMLEWEKLAFDKLEKMIELNIVKLTKRYNIKFQEWRKKQ